MDFRGPTSKEREGRERGREGEKGAERRGGEGKGGEREEGEEGKERGV